MDVLLASGASDYGTALWSGVEYIAGTIGYIAAPVLIALVAARPKSDRRFATCYGRHEPDRRLVVLAFLVPLLLPALAAPLVGGKLGVALGARRASIPLPVIVLVVPHGSCSRATAALRILAFAVALPLLAIAASPAVAFMIHRFGTDTDSPHYRLVAQAVEKVWRETTDQPLRIVGSYENLFSGTLFYYRDGPSAL